MIINNIKILKITIKMIIEKKGIKNKTKDIQKTWKQETIWCHKTIKQLRKNNQKIKNNTILRI